MTKKKEPGATPRRYDAAFKTEAVRLWHPSSGDPAPSAPDIAITRQLREASKTVDIELIDHVILGRRESDPLGVGFFSFRSAGLL